jgi:uncharacterized integral membrane protein (TIGR00698 family)
MAMGTSTIDDPATTLPGPRTGTRFWAKAPLLAGLTLIAIIATLARIGGHYSGVVPDVVLALGAGIALKNYGRLPAAVAPGTRFVLQYVLRAAIVMLGAGLTFRAIAKLGFATVVLIVSCVLIAMCLGAVLAKLGGIGARIGTLIGAGTAICGGSAIIAIGPLIEATDAEIAYAVTTIFTFNIVAILAYPAIGHALQMTQVQFGSWTGTAVNDTSVVVATGYLFGHLSGATATVVKLTRTLLLMPLALTVATLHAADGARERGSRPTRRELSRAIPWFVLYFAAMVVLNSLNLIPASVASAFSQIAGFLIVMVLAAVGLNVDLKKISAMGFQPLVVGFVLATTMAIISLTLVHALRIG